MTPPLIAHCESHLGPVVCGWSVDADGTPMPFQVVLFEDLPIDGASAISTVGLSDVGLRVGLGPRRLRQELIMMFRRSEGPRNLPGVLLQLGMEALRRDTAFVPGEVVGPRGELVERASVSSIYIAPPVYLPDSFQVCRSTPEPVVFAWLVPITDDEAAFVRTKGRDAFEDLLASTDPDLLDAARPSIVPHLDSPPPTH